MIPYRVALVSNFSLSVLVVYSRTSSSMLRAIPIVPVRRWCQSVEVVRVQGHDQVRRPVPVRHGPNPHNFDHPPSLKNVENGFGPQRCCEKTATCRRSHPSCVGIGLVSTTGNIWNGHRRRWCRCIGWSWEATPVRICHHRSKEISVD